MVLIVLGSRLPAPAVLLWNDPDSTRVCNTGPGRDILDGAIKRDDTSTDTLYFKFNIDPLSDASTEQYLAAFELCEGDTPQLGIGNAAEAWAYTAFFRADEFDGTNSVTRYVDLRTSQATVEASGTTPAYELPRRGVRRTIVFKVQFVAGGEDLVTVWLNPDLSSGMTEVLQPEGLTTRFSANASFDEIRLRHEGGGEGWVFSNMAIATSFADFVDPSSAMPGTGTTTSLFDTRRLSFQTWHREPGMPSGAIHALAQTAEGYLWLAGSQQLSRFDGTRFVPVDLNPLPGNTAFSTLFGDSHGALWIGTTGGGLIRYADGHFDSWTTNTGLPANTVTALREDRDGSIWIGTTAGLVSWNEGVIKRCEGLDRLDGLTITALFPDRKGTLWIGAKGAGVFFLEKGRLSQVEPASVQEVLRSPQSLLEDRQGRIWVGAGGDVVLCRDDDGWHRYRIPRHSKTPDIRAIAEEPDGTVWAGSSSQGLFQFRDGNLVALASSTGFTESQVQDLLVDRDGDLWVAGGAGLCVLRRQHCFLLGQAEGLRPGVVGSVAEVTPGVIWAIQPGHGLYRWEGQSFRRLNAAGIDPRDPTLGAMLVARDGGCWIACTNGVRLFRDPQAVADESLLFELREPPITALAEAPAGDIWAGNRMGQLWRLHRGAWTRHLQLDPPTAITALAVESAGMVWIGTERGGLYLLDDPVTVRVDTGDSPAQSSICGLQRDSDGTLWIGSAGGGLAVLPADSRTRYTPINGLADNTVLGMLQDQSGHLWLHDSSGLTCIVKPVAPDSRAEILGSYPMATPSVEELGSATSNYWSFPTGCATRSGRLWFATRQGILVAEPPDFETNHTAPVLILEKVLVDDTPARGFTPMIVTGASAGPSDALPARLRIGPGRHRLELRYTSPEFGATRQVRFRYKMQGLDPDWVDAGATRTAQYSYLPHGNYRFILAAYGPHGRMSQTSVGLSISPYVWQRWWVIALAGLGFGAAIGGSARYVEKRRLKRRLIRLEQEHALERERTRIAQDLHDEMGAKLCRISFLSEHTSRLEPGSGEIKEQIEAIADDSRGLLHSLDEIVWVVNPQNDTLEHVASYIGQYAGSYFEGTGIQCGLAIPNHLPSVAVSSQTRHNLFLAVHEALTNALKHSGATAVKVSVAYDGGRLTIGVTDNGNGFATAPAGVKPLVGQESRNGLLNMRQRMDNIAGQCRIESAPGQGTRIEFAVHLNATENLREKP